MEQPGRKQQQRSDCGSSSGMTDGSEISIEGTYASDESQVRPRGFAALIGFPGRAFRGSSKLFSTMGDKVGSLSPHQWSGGASNCAGNGGDAAVGSKSACLCCWQPVSPPIAAAAMSGHSGGAAAAAMPAGSRGCASLRRRLPTRVDAASMQQRNKVRHRLPRSMRASGGKRRGGSRRWMRGQPTTG